MSQAVPLSATPVHLACGFPTCARTTGSPPTGRVKRAEMTSPGGLATWQVRGLHGAVLTLGFSPLLGREVQAVVTIALIHLGSWGASETHFHMCVGVSQRLRTVHTLGLMVSGTCVPVSSAGSSLVWGLGCNPGMCKALGSISSSEKKKKNQK